MTLESADRREALDASGHLYPVILCGGSGTRLWPLSRRAYPKQLLALTSEQSLLQETAARAQNTLKLPPPLVLCGEDQRFLVSQQLAAAGIVPEAILCEPAPRNTAPALAVAAMYLRKRDPQAIMLVLPSDHHIGDGVAFRGAVSRALAPAVLGRLVCFGIPPTRPETGYGYIERGAPLADEDGVFAVARFKEKPDARTAEKLVADGAHLWNSGMFVLPATVLLEELDHYDHDIASACALALARHRDQNGYIHLDPTAFEAAPAISIDYAVMERTRHAVVVPADIDWSDIGSWRSLRDAGPRDDNGNMIRGDVIAEGMHDSVVHATGRLVATVGVKDLIIVETGDAVLVGAIGKAADVGRLAQRLKNEGRPEAETHSRVHRPWGFYESIGMGARFQVKHICVGPGQRLSLQMHHHRAEHWVVVGGTGLITRGGESRLLRENESTFIALGVTHRLENPGKLPLHLIEVQVGEYLGEDDIVRFDDTYGRSVDDTYGRSVTAAATTPAG